MPNFQVVIDGCDILEFECKYDIVFTALQKTLPDYVKSYIVQEIDENGESCYFGEKNNDGVTSLWMTVCKLQQESLDLKNGIWETKCPKHWLPNPNDNIPF